MYIYGMEWNLSLLTDPFLLAMGTIILCFYTYLVIICWLLDFVSVLL